MMKGMRLTDLAKRAECSQSLLSKIENNKATPSLSLLHRLALALGTNIPWFFSSEGEIPRIVLRREERLVMEFDQREVEGTTAERLAPYLDGQLLQAMLFIVEPGGHSLSDITHEGEEFGYVLEGELELTIDGQPFVLRACDTFQFRSERPHRYHNRGDRPARVLWINTPPTY
jgi:quercetin dioxygenase-like cupin family protein